MQCVCLGSLTNPVQVFGPAHQQLEIKCNWKISCILRMLLLCFSFLLECEQKVVLCVCDFGVEILKTSHLKSVMNKVAHLAVFGVTKQLHIYISSGLVFSLSMF